MGVSIEISQSNVVPKFLEERVELLERQKGLDVKPHAVPSLLRQCGEFKALAQGKRLHAYLVRTRYDKDRYFGNLLVEMYGKCGSIDNATAVFESMFVRNVFSWTILISAYVQNGYYREAVWTMHRMDLEGVKADRITFVAVLDACSGSQDLSTGRNIHDRVRGCVDSDVVLCTAVLNMYGKCGSVDDAKVVFEKMAMKDVVAWNAMVATYAQNGHCRKALKLFRRMAMERVPPNKSTYVSLLDACASMAGIARGREVHRLVDKAGFLSDRVVRCAVINMYGKCGSVVEARQVFEAFPDRDVVLWNSMIAAYAQNGHGKKSLEVFEKMKEQSDARPDSITFVHVLCACSHARLVDSGRAYFESMRSNYGLQPSAQHYRCMIDILGRSGELDQAWIMLQSMPLEPDTLAWTTLLSACRAHSNLELAEVCAERLFELDPVYSAPYVLLSNIYAARNRWEDVARIRRLMVERGVKKPTGRSSIEVGDKVHVFMAGDRSHPRSEEIYREVARLGVIMKSLGYVPDTSVVLREADDDEEKEQLLCYHSEKLAIAFGNVASTKGETLYVIKNLRVCTDCHTASKFISKIVGREIVLRDPYRFHHVRDGACSCGDYW